MTLFYKNPEDIEHSDENPDVVNINEVCQHCGNASGYTLIGKVDSVSEEEADKYEAAEGGEENELDLDFEEPTEEVDAEGTGEGAEEMSDEEFNDLNLELEEIPEEESEEEKKEESLNLSKAAPSEEETEHKSENLTLNEDTTSESLTEDAKKFIVKWWKSFKDENGQLDTKVDEIKEFDDIEKAKDYARECAKKDKDGFVSVFSKDGGSQKLVANFKDGLEESLNTSEEAPSEHETENSSEETTLNEEVDKDLDKKLAEHNDYIEYLKNLINQDEEALKKAENDEIKAAIQRRLDAFNADLEAALPDAIKEETPIEEEIPVEESAEEVPTEVQAEEEPKEDEAPVEEALTENTEECKVVLSDEPEREVFAGSKEDCEKIIEKNKNTNTAKEHGLEILEPAVDESLNKSEAAVSENETENESENLTLNEGAEAEIDSIIASWGLNESLTEEGDLDKLLDSDEFKTPVTDAEIDAAREDAKEESLEECNKQKLTEEPDPEVSAIIDS
jgi:hypothetical protein